MLGNFKDFNKNKNAQKLASIMNDLRDAVFGSLLPSELEGDTNTGIKNIDTTYMPALQDEKSAAERQQEQGLKISTPQQMITRLPILLAQLKARNNSQKSKNEIRQLFYSLHISKKLSKTIYNSLMNTI